MTRNNILPFRKILPNLKRKRKLEELYILFCLMTYGQETDPEELIYASNTAPLFVTRDMILRIEQGRPHMPYH